MIRVPAPARFAVASVCLVLALGACGDDAAPSASGGTATPAASGGTAAAPGSSSGSSSPSSSMPVGKSNPAPPADTAKPSVAISSAPPVKVGKPAAFTNNVRVTVSKVRSVTVKASGPGDIAGAGVSVELTVKNNSSKSFDLSGLVVTATYGSDDKPAIPGGVQNGDPMTGKLRAGRTATGEYVFNVPTSQAKSLQVQVSSNASPIILVFER
jgi:hypothetical protein